MRMPIAERSSLSSLKEVTVPSVSGTLVPLSELVTVKEGIDDKTIYHKNLKRVTYVIGDVAGIEESPVYVILKMKEAIRNLKLPEGYELQQYSTIQPPLEQKYAMKWDGEWHITYEVFRDLGIAFTAVLILIYILVVAWFRSFLIPLIIMAPIPLTLVGILPGHSDIRRLLHGDVDDRIHCTVGHHRKKFDPARRLHPDGMERRRRSQRCSYQGRSGALQADRADRGGSCGRFFRHALRSDIPGTGDCDDVRRSGCYRAYTRRGSAALL